MKGYCPICNELIDETEYMIKEKMCIHCYEKNKAGKKTKFESLSEQELREWIKAWKNGDRKKLSEILDKFENKKKGGD